MDLPLSPCLSGNLAHAVDPLDLGVPGGISIVTMADHPTRSVCTLAALTSLILVITGVPGVRMGDLPFLVFLLAPYLLLDYWPGGTVSARASQQCCLLPCWCFPWQAQSCLDWTATAFTRCPSTDWCSG